MRGDLFLGDFIGLACAHGLLHPVIGQREVGLACRIVAALQVSLGAIVQLQILHRIVVGGIDADCLLQILHRFIHLIGIGRDDLLAYSLGLLHIPFCVILKPRGSENGDVLLVGLRPVDYADRVVGLGVPRIDRNDLHLVGLSLVILVDVATDRGFLAQRIQLFWVLGKNGSAAGE